MESRAKACYLRLGMQTETLAIVRPHATGDHELAWRLSEGFRDSSQTVAMYLSSEVCVLSEEVLSGTTLLVASPRRWAKVGVAVDWQKLMPPQGFVVLPRRWVVERTSSWID
jgi:hypothetical protein